VLVWDSETQRRIVSLGAKQSPSLAYSLGFHHDPGSLSLLPPFCFRVLVFCLCLCLVRLFLGLCLCFCLRHFCCLCR